MHQYKSAYNYLSKYHTITDSLFTLEKNKQINEIKTKYETEKKIKEQNINPKERYNIKDKYTDSQLDKKHKKDLIEDIVLLMEEEKFFLNSQFTITDFAKELKTNRYYISQIINDHFNTKFNNFVNEYRVKEARKLLISDEYKNFSIEGIASTVGFHSKATFNTAFKKFTGVTPSFFQKNSKNLA
ncbi:MAG: AraC family transcriptional regulator [Bacteroidales bacterium]|nr:AraC family transcriptional regulator [Bacteroidales bacterium]